MLNKSSYSEKIRVLIIEDHVDLSKNISDFLDDGCFVLDFAQDGMTALYLLANNLYDVVVLDLNLPGVSGYEICKRIRDDLKSNIPIIIMTASGELLNKIQVFNEGADDYIVKPFELKELEMRIMVHYRRFCKSNSGLITTGDISYDPGTLTAYFGDATALKLKGKGSQIFEILIREYPNYISYKNLHEKLWGDRIVGTNVLRSHIYMLRKQIFGTAGCSAIETVHGRGLRLNPNLA